jgi:hypothetical protein
VLYCVLPEPSFGRSREEHVEETMPENTCAACDCTLDGTAITVTIAGRAVEVCCNDCALALNEAHASAVAARSEVRS